MIDQRVLGPQQAQILRLWIDPHHPDHERRQLFGLQVMHLTDLPSGVVYPALDALRRRKLLVSEQEADHGQPGLPRVYYKLVDPDGGRVALAKQAQTKRAQQSVRRPLRTRGAISVERALS
jgi:DNA-binding PadR family transcriptional regulator